MGQDRGWGDALRPGAMCVHTRVCTHAHMHTRRPLPPPRPVTSVSRAAVSPSRPPLPLQPPPDTLGALLLVFLKLLFPRLLRTGLRWNGARGSRDGAGGGGWAVPLRRCQPLAGGVTGECSSGVGMGGVRLGTPHLTVTAGAGRAPKVPVGVWVGDVCREPCTALHVTRWESQSLPCPRIARLGEGGGGGAAVASSPLAVTRCPAHSPAGA